MKTTAATSFNDIILTPSQQSALSALEEFMDSDVPCFLLKGYAGTGKTFLIRGLVKWMKQLRRQVVLMAPTGRAAQILSAKTNTSTSTIHRVIYFGEDLKSWKKHADEDELFRLMYSLNSNPNIKGTVFIVDEASMVSNAFSDNEFLQFGSGYLLKDMIKYIWPNQINNDYKLIFSGDYAQLPPVDMGFSPALDASYLKEKFMLNCMESELTEVVRQKEGGLILENATMLRRRIADKTFGSLRLQTGEEVSSLPYQMVVDKFLHLSGSGNDQAIIVAHSNRAVYSYNRRIRSKLFPGQRLPASGDRLVVVQNNYFNERLLLNGETGTIVSINNSFVHERTVTLNVKIDNQKETAKKVIKLSFREAVIRFGDVETEDVSTLILDNVLFSDERDISFHEQQALFVDFKIRHNIQKGDNIGDRLKSDKYFNALRVKFGYALTCHKAQGGEWKNVLVDCQTSMGVNNENYFRWLYTAITRARENLLLLNMPVYETTRRLRAAGEQKESIAETEKVETEPTDLPTPILSFAEILYEKISPSLGSADFFTRDVMFRPYSLQFILQKDEKKALIRIFFNARERVTNLEVLEAANFTQHEIKTLFSLLHLNENQIKFNISQDSRTSATPVIGDLDAFLAGLKKKIGAALAETDIQIDKVEAKDYHEIYHFSQGTASAVIKLYYNKKKQFTRYEAVPNRCNGLESEIIPLIKTIEL